MKKKILVVLGICTLTLTGCGKTIPKLANGQEVVASIDGVKVTADDIYSELKDQYGISIVIDKIDSAIADKVFTNKKEAEEYADKQIDSLKAQYEMYDISLEEVLPQYGYSDITDLREDIINSYKKDYTLTNYLEEKLTDKEIQKYYEEEIYGEITAKHILIKPETTDDMTTDQKNEAEEKAKKEAEELIEKIKAGEDFEKLAEEYSDDTGSASQGGLVTNLTKDRTAEEFFEAALELKDGEYTQNPVKTTYGYHIILKVSQNEKPELEDVIDDIKETMVQNMLAEDSNLTVTAWDEIRKKYNMSINDSTLKDNYNSVIDSYKTNENA